MTTTSPEPTGTQGDPRSDGPSTADPPGFSPTAAVVAGLAVAGLDLATARAVVDARARRRVRARRGMLAGGAAVALLGVVIALIPRDRPDDVIADAGTTTTTGYTSSTVPPETVPGTTAAPVTSAVTTTTTRPPSTTSPVTTTTTPPTTLAPNQPLTASLASPTAVPVGKVVTLEIKWSDADLGDPTGPRATAVWGDVNVTAPISAETRPPCDAPGAPGSGSLPLQFRYSRAGTYNVTVQIRTCDGVGAFAENQTFTTTVTVNDAKDAQGVTLRGVVLKGPSGGPSPDGSTLTYTATAGAEQAPREAVPILGLISTVDGTPVTVAVVGPDFVGSVRAKQAGVCAIGLIRPGSDPVTLAPVPTC